MLGIRISSQNVRRYRLGELPVFCYGNFLLFFAIVVGFFLHGNVLSYMSTKENTRNHNRHFVLARMIRNCGRIHIYIQSANRKMFPNTYSLFSYRRRIVVALACSRDSKIVINFLSLDKNRQRNVCRLSRLKFNLPNWARATMNEKV